MLLCPVVDIPEQCEVMTNGKSMGLAQGCGNFYALAM